jgi:ATP-dependent Clp protease adapter protein ClpS
MQLASEESIRQAAASANCPSLAEHSFTLEPCGVLKVLVVDDQRTMRQMVCMIFQNFCKVRELGIGRRLSHAVLWRQR